MKHLLPALAAAALVAVLPGPALAAATHHAAADATTAPATVSVKLADTKDALRGLWFSHIFWVRNVVVARLHGDARIAAAGGEDRAGGEHQREAELRGASAHRPLRDAQPSVISSTRTPRCFR